MKDAQKENIWSRFYVGSRVLWMALWHP